MSVKVPFEVMFDVGSPPGNIIDQFATTRSINVGDLSVGHRHGPLGIQSLENLPVVVLPAGIPRNAVRIPDALNGLGVVAIRGVSDKVAVLGSFGAVGGIFVVLIVVGSVILVVPGNRWVC